MVGGGGNGLLEKGRRKKKANILGQTKIQKWKHFGLEMRPKWQYAECTLYPNQMLLSFASKMHNDHPKCLIQTSSNSLSPRNKRGSDKICVFVLLFLQMLGQEILRFLWEDLLMLEEIDCKIKKYEIKQ